MDCDRCGGTLESYTLDGNEAYVCPDCGFVDTAIEHEATLRPEPEPWDVALERFHDQYVDSEVSVVGSGETAAVVAVDASADGAQADDQSESEVDEEPDDQEPEAAAQDDADSAPTEPGADEEADAQTEEREKPA